ncbi:sulfotransferase family 2 domain-containing protein [uncultured Lentibacter sp.]|uniref:sulfotransferase family 2 domain-containing protein n=1 Tax=uncultured Lentibacter sp. TaxID=1659309 RepID=UPI00261958F3|nr:sulfotransferase family 2 domain-containing protein [uncultured Lentibacter sp.]
MPLLHSATSVIFFAHIPKTGGSSLEHWLAGRGQLRLRGRTPLPGARCTPQHMHAADYAPLLEGQLIDAEFAVLRDPVARMVSEYRYRRAQVLKRGRREMPPFERWAARAMRLYAQDPYFLDNHIRPQAQFVRATTRLFAFEAGLAPITHWLEAFCGVSGPKLEHRLASTGEDVPVSAAMRARIEAFYAEDYALIAQSFGGTKNG